jgi:hypothetical protein
MLNELSDLFSRVAVTPHNLYSKFWQAPFIDTSLFQSVCPMLLVQDALPLVKFECAHLCLKINRSHIKVT